MRHYGWVSFANFDTCKCGVSRILEFSFDTARYHYYSVDGLDLGYRRPKCAAMGKKKGRAA